MSESTDINVEADLRALVAEVLEIEGDEVTADAHFVKDLGMDSMMALEILASVEKKYGITVPEESLPQFVDLKTTVGIVQEILNKR